MKEIIYNSEKYFIKEKLQAVNERSSGVLAERRRRRRTNTCRIISVGIRP
jgi:hypothetical protein